MCQSADYTKSYSVGDTYDTTNKTKGIKGKNVIITGAGTYTVSLDVTECGAAKGFAFSALGISNGEDLFPGYTISIDKILINNSPYQLNGKEFTTSDDKHCTRVNLQCMGKRPAQGSAHSRWRFYRLLRPDNGHQR